MLSKLNNDYDILDKKFPMVIDGIEYQYSIKDKIATISHKNKVVGELDLPRIISISKNADEGTQSKCPACIIGGGIILSQGLCTLSAGGEHAYCGGTCLCGVADVTTTCLFGFRKTSCTCQMPCPIYPDPSSLYPGTNGWLTGVPFLDYGDGTSDPWVFDVQ